MPDFEVFDRSIVARQPVAMTVTIQKDGVLSFSPAAFQAMGEPARIKLLHNARERAIAFEAAGAWEPAKTAFRVRPSGGRAHLVSAMEFCRYIGLDLSQSRRYPLVLDKDGDKTTLIVSLTKTGKSVTSNRARKPQ